MAKVATAGDAANIVEGGIGGPLAAIAAAAASMAATCASMEGAAGSVCVGGGATGDGAGTSAEGEGAAAEASESGDGLTSTLLERKAANSACQREPRSAAVARRGIVLGAAVVSGCCGTGLGMASLSACPAGAEAEGGGLAEAGLAGVPAMLGCEDAAADPAMAPQRRTRERAAAPKSTAACEHT